MFCVVTSFGCTKHRINFNILVRMRPHFLPVTLAFCLLILQGYQVCMSSDQKKTLSDDSLKPPLDDMRPEVGKDAANVVQNGDKQHKKLYVQQKLHHSTKINNPGVRQGQKQHLETHKQQQHATRANLKQHVIGNRKIQNQNKPDKLVGGAKDKKLRGTSHEIDPGGHNKMLDQVQPKTAKVNDLDITAKATASKQYHENKQKQEVNEETLKQESQTDQVTVKHQHHSGDKPITKPPSSPDSVDPESRTKDTSPEQEHKEQGTKSPEESLSKVDSHEDVVDSPILSGTSSGEQAGTPEDGTASALKVDVVTDGDTQLAKDEAVPADRPAEDQPTDKLSPPQGDAKVKLPDASTESPASVPDDGTGAVEDEEKMKPSAEKDKDVEQPEIIQVPEATEDNLPSFDEWKQKMLAEQAEQEKTKSQEVQNMQPISAMPANNKKGTKNINYASVTCGAKIRASNPEAQHPGFILTENKDQYMINPCKVKKWFVVELCTPVQIQALEIGNLELFSSLPESFLVQVSEGFPTKEWKPVGTFHARNDRAIQSFVVENEQMYAHYIRVEMLSHYGAEHYCPLTVLRVYGLTVIEADEAEEEAPIPEDTDEMPIQDTEKDLTLFSSATDTVINLVKTMLSHGEADEDKAENDTLTPETLTDAVQMKADVANSSAKNITQEAVPDEHTEPCIPEVKTNQETTNTLPLGAPTEPRAPDATVDKVSVPESIQGAAQPEVPSVEDDTTEQPIDIVTLIQRPVIPLRDYLTNCHYCSSDTKPSCYSDRQSICGYHRILTFVPPMCCVQPSEIRDASRSLDVMPQDSGQRTLPESGATMRSTTAVDVETKVPGGVPGGTTDESISIRLDETLLPSHFTVTVEAARHETPTATPPLSSVQYTEPVVQTDSGTLHTSTNMYTEPMSKVQDSSPSHVGPEVLEIRPSVTTPHTSDTAAEASIDQTTTVSPDPLEVDPSKVEVQQEVTEMPDASEAGLSNGLPDIYAEDPSNNSPESDMETMPAQASDDIQYQKISIGKKETTFMKLKNKIRSLELNLNLSSQYLEQLSQRYKKQMEEMYISLNKTITRLADTSRKAEEKDIKQQEHIANLLRQISALNSSFETMKGNISVIHLELIERHLYLMIIEAAIFLLVLAWCLHRQEKNIRNLQGRTRRLTETQSRETGIRMSSNKCVRRNSTDNTPTRLKLDSTTMIQRRAYDDCDIRKSGILPTNLGFANARSQQIDVIKKKKKRKSSNANKAQTSGHLIGTSLANSVSLSCHSSSADLSTDCQKSAVTVNGTYMGHAPKKRDYAGAKYQQMNGHTAHLSSDSASSSSRERPESNDQIRRHSSEHLIKAKASHRKSPSLDRNLYSTLSVNGMDDSDCNADDHGLTFGDYKDMIRKQS